MIDAILNKLAPWLRLWPLALALAAFGAGWAVNGWRWEAKQADALQAAIDQKAKDEQIANKKSEELEKQLASIQSNTRELNRRLAHETTDPAYACRVPPSGLQLLRDAISGNAAGEPDGTVPGPSPPRT